MFKKTNNEKFFTSPKSPHKSEMNKHARNSDENMITMSRCRHLNAIKNLTEQFVNNFNLFPSKEKKGWKCKTTHKEKILTNGVLLIVLSNKEVEDATSSSEENKYEMVVMIKRDIQEFKETHMMY